MAEVTIVANETHGTAFNRSQSSILSVPNETLMRIFELQNSVFDGYRLSKTCQRLRHFWYTHRGQLNEAILSRQIVCFDAAKRLIEARERRNILEDLSGPFPNTPSSHKKTQPFRITQASQVYEMHKNARRAERICDIILQEIVTRIKEGLDGSPHFDDCCKARPVQGRPHERQRAIWGIYFLQSFVLAHGGPEVVRYHQEIEAMGMVKLYIIWRIVDFCIDGSLAESGQEGEDLAEGLNITSHEEPSYSANPPDGGYEATPGWDDAWRFIVDLVVLRRKTEGDDETLLVNGPCDRCVMLNETVPTGEAIWKLNCSASLRQEAMA